MGDSRVNQVDKPEERHIQKIERSGVVEERKSGEREDARGVERWAGWWGGAGEKKWCHHLGASDLVIGRAGLPLGGQREHVCVVESERDVRILAPVPPRNRRATTHCIARAFL